MEAQAFVCAVITISHLAQCLAVAAAQLRVLPEVLLQIVRERKAAIVIGRNGLYMLVYIAQACKSKRKARYSGLCSISECSCLQLGKLLLRQRCALLIVYG